MLLNNSSFWRGLTVFEIFYQIKMKLKYTLHNSKHKNPPCNRNSNRPVILNKFHKFYAFQWTAILNTLKIQNFIFFVMSVCLKLQVMVWVLTNRAPLEDK